MEGYIYFLQVSNHQQRPIKIGYTGRTPEDRLREIRNVMPFHQVDLIGCFPAPREHESFLKSVFKQNMIAGQDKATQTSEWFFPDKKLVDYIARVCR